MDNLIQKYIEGFSLIEILITVLVLAIGLLGFASIQMTAVNASQESYTRSQTNSITESIAARMRANRGYVNTAVVADNVYNQNAATDNYTRWCISSGPVITQDTYCPAVGQCNCTAATCNGAQMAAFDMWNVCEQELRPLNFVNSEIGVICHDEDTTDLDACSPGSRFTVVIGWTPSIRISDVGDAAYEKQSNLCQAANDANGAGMSDTKTCVMTEIVP